MSVGRVGPPVEGVARRGGFLQRQSLYDAHRNETLIHYQDSTLICKVDRSDKAAVGLAYGLRDFSLYRAMSILTQPS